MSASNRTIEEPGEEAAPRPGRVMLLKRLLSAPLQLLRRLRRPKADEESEAAEEASSAARAPRRRDDGVAEAVPAPPLWRRLLPYGLVLLAGGAIGGGAVFWLSAQVIAHQSAELSERQDEVTRLKGVLAGYDRMMLESHKKLEVEKGKRAELGNRLAIAQSDLARRPPSEDGRGTGAQGSSGSAAEAGKTADCTLRPGSIGSTLKACLEEFNRK